MTSQKDYDEYLHEKIVEAERELNLISMHLVIDNIYPDGTVVTERDVDVPDPGRETEGEAWDITLADWAWEELFDYTGTGRTEGDSAYFIKITACEARPDLVGQEFEMGT